MHHFQNMFLIGKDAEMDTILFIQTLKEKYREYIRDKVCDSIAFILNEMVQQPIYAKLLGVPTEQLSIPAECFAAEAAGCACTINYYEKPYVKGAPFATDDPYGYIDKCDKYTMAKRILSNSVKYSRDPLRLKNYIASAELVPNLETGEIRMAVSGEEFLEWFDRFLTMRDLEFSYITRFETKLAAEDAGMYDADWKTGMAFKIASYDDIDSLIWNDPRQNGSVQTCYVVSQIYFVARAAMRQAKISLYAISPEQNRQEGLTQSVVDGKPVGVREDALFDKNYMQCMKNHESTAYKMTKEIYDFLLTATLDLKVPDVAKTIFDTERKEHKNPLQMHDLLGYKFEERLAETGKDRIFLSKEYQKANSSRFENLDLYFADAI